MLKRLIAFVLMLCVLPVCVPAEESVQAIVINEVMASNGMFENEKSYDWIELYNRSKKTVDISGWKLSDGKKNLEKFIFPKGTKIKAGGYVTVFCTGEEDIEPGTKTPFYATFSLKAEGETLYLTDVEGNRVQTLEYPQQYGNVSWGLPEGFAGQPAEMDYGYLVNATRAKKNDAVVYPARTADPGITTAGGFYPEGVTVYAECPKGATLRYTTDGETPGEKSPIFPEEGLLISKTTALRVRAFREGEVPSVTVSATYIVEAEQLTPIVCLTTDDQYLFNKKTGALVRGSGDTPNYEKEWEYPVNIEYFNADGVCEINQMGTFTASGHSARQNAASRSASAPRMP